jgi:SAM-dependent methyltransferase
MRPGVTELRNFYQSQLGRTARAIISGHIAGHWNDICDASVLGLGYAVPYVNEFADSTKVTLAMMPAAQGALIWPQGKPRTALVDERHLPLPSSSINLVLAVHFIEMCEWEKAALREIWRILTPQGRLLMIVPNRRGMWAGFDSTPFGHGKPYSIGQLEHLLTSAMFTPFALENALYIPPVGWGTVLRGARSWERLGQNFWPGPGGVIVAEAAKQLYGLVKGRKTQLLYEPAGADREVVARIKEQV